MTVVSRFLHTRRICLAAVALFAAGAGRCDTVTTADNLSVYGIIREVTATTITLEGTFPSGTKVYAVPRERVVRIDLNSTKYNPGAPPRTLGLGPAKGQTTQAAGMLKDTIVLKGSTSKPCKLLAIDDDGVHCEGNSYPRYEVLYILIGRGRQI